MSILTSAIGLGFLITMASVFASNNIKQAATSNLPVPAPVPNTVQVPASSPKATSGPDLDEAAMASAAKAAAAYVFAASSQPKETGKQFAHRLGH